MVQHDDDTHLGSFAVPIAEAGDFETWTPDRQDLPARRADEYDAVISLGGVAMPDEDDRHPWISHELALMRRSMDVGVPVLGICLGSQLLARAAGGEVRPSDASEVGWYTIDLLPEAAEDPVLSGLPTGFRVFHWHHYAWELPQGGRLLARTPAANQAFRVAEHAWGLQFHIEVDEPLVRSWVLSGPGQEDMARHGFATEPVLEETSEREAAYVERARD